MLRRKGLVAVAGLSSLLLSGATSPTGCPSGQIGPSTGEVVGGAVAIGAVVVVGTVVLVEVHKSHHTIKGCVTAGPDGLRVHNQGDKKIYALTGVTANVKAGDIVKVHGDKNKHQKDSSGDEDFVVQSIGKDYGPCKAELVPAASPTTARATP